MSRSLFKNSPFVWVFRKVRSLKSIHGELEESDSFPFTGVKMTTHCIILTGSSAVSVKTNMDALISAWRRSWCWSSGCNVLIYRKRNRMTQFWVSSAPSDLQYLIESDLFLPGRLKSAVLHHCFMMTAHVCRRRASASYWVLYDVSQLEARTRLFCWSWHVLYGFHVCYIFICYPYSQRQA